MQMIKMRPIGKGRYWVGHTYGLTNNARQSWIGNDTDSLAEAKDAAYYLSLAPTIFGYGIVKDMNTGKIIFHTGKDK